MTKDELQSAYRALNNALEESANQVEDLPMPEEDRRLRALVRKGMGTSGLDSIQGSPPPLVTGVQARTPRHPSRRRTFLFASMAAAAVAVLSVPVWYRYRMAPFPEHVLSLSGTAQLMKTDQVKTSRFTFDSTLAMTIRPAIQIADETEVRTFLVKDGKTMEWPINLTRSNSGTFRLQARVRDLPLLAAGTWDLVCVVGYKGRLPTTQYLSEVLATSQPQGRNWRSIRHQIEIVEH